MILATLRRKAGFSISVIRSVTVKFQMIEENGSGFSVKRSLLELVSRKD